MREMRLIAALLAVAALGQFATAADPPPRNMAPPVRIPDPIVETPTPAGETVPTSSMPSAVRRAVVADAATRFRVGENDVVLTRAEQVTWPDGSLGCGQPGQMYTQMQVAGFRVIAKTTAGELLYHTDTRGTAVSCAPSPPAPGNLRGPASKLIQPVTAPPKPAPSS